MAQVPRLPWRTPKCRANLAVWGRCHRNCLCLGMRPRIQGRRAVQVPARQTQSLEWISRCRAAQSGQGPHCWLIELGADWPVQPIGASWCLSRKRLRGRGLGLGANSTRAGGKQVHTAGPGCGATRCLTKGTRRKTTKSSASKLTAQQCKWDLQKVPIRVKDRLCRSMFDETSRARQRRVPDRRGAAAQSLTVLTAMKVHVCC